MWLLHEHPKQLLKNDTFFLSYKKQKMPCQSKKWKNAVPIKKKRNAKLHAANREFNDELLNVVKI